MPVITVLRGFKIHYSVLDAFLRTNGVNQTHGYPPSGKTDDKIATLLSAKMGDDGKGARVFIPHRESYDQSTFAYVAYCWVHVFSQHEVKFDTTLTEVVPERFKALQKEMLALGEEKCEEAEKIGLHVVFTENRSWFPEMSSPFEEGPVECCQCGKTFESFALKQLHRREAHESTEGVHLLPEI
ncbi:uncharacterized protein F4822DRAFT_44566 [Hypoxylon trugodes]|uniref:uncharacterized protein n=1 Tax=Hypoxylon trugodes TaxID=326681 RepID=UPI00219D3201|nr:uncharacterized protein F4822DRAFT_44566 [Hypoxylon trugodes]KAI1394292.1 hypothetical protein F4822DRAFT_44566 [Hypoxylon trugodes]